MAQRSELSADLARFAGRRLMVPVADEWMATAQVAKELGISHALAAILLLSEIGGSDDDPFPAVIRSGRRLMAHAVVVDRLRQRPARGEVATAYINVRLGPATYADPIQEGRRYVGCHRSFSARQQYLAATRWWNLSDLEPWIGLPFVASISGFVVLAGRITSTRTIATPDPLSSFEIDLDDSFTRDLFQEARIPVHPGGPALKVGDPHRLTR